MTEYTLTRPAVGWTWMVTTIRIAAALLLIGWSALWLPDMFTMIRAQTAIGQHGLHGGVTGYQVFELLFVAGHCGVRWLPGVAVAAGLFWLSARLQRKARAR
jgi:hypothetical protein